MFEVYPGWREVYRVVDYTVNMGRKGVLEPKEWKEMLDHFYIDFGNRGEDINLI